ncbi:hypothetical protein HYPSUDRAFT_208213 [Hypholoma sublateritium FD-334 SS-4]|uniref:Uncharacterized protein n=1 Tax=Hypholoma sublateritium (strain FD-334 SS-4) TaxID=945553 RepID=A0A0D2LW08_HYPSF|nr:hypothetical protein HYPSUDRAFT_208213 [Hypholoma sublateritium FD-334 SS-4]
MQSSDKFTAAFNLENNMVYQTPIYPRYIWEPHKTLYPEAKLYAPPSPSQSLRAQQAALRNAAGSAPSFLTVPQYPRVKTVSARSTSAGSETGARSQKTESLQDFFIERENCSLLDLYDEYQLQEDQGFVKGIPSPPFPREVRKPVFKENILQGTEGVWTILCWLIAESQVLFCREILNATSLYLSAGNLTSTVFEHCSSRPLFQQLVELHSDSPMADYLSGGRDKNRTWNYDVIQIASCPFIRQLFRWLRTYILEYSTRFMTGVRHDTAFIATQSPTMEIKLLPNKLAGGSTHIEAPGTRSGQAEALRRLIHPEHGISAGDPKMPRLEVIQQSMFQYLSGESNIKVANSVVGHLGRTNISLAVKAFLDVKSTPQLPTSIIPLAGLFLESEILSVARASFLHNGERIAFSLNYHTFAQVEGENFGHISRIWKDITIPKTGPLGGTHPLYKDAKELMDHLE